MGNIVSYDIMISIGGICMVFLAAILCQKRYHSVRYTVEIILFSFFLIQMGSFVSNFLKGLAGAQWSELKTFWKFFFRDNGAHFIGRVLFCTWLFPVGYSFIFRKRSSDWKDSFDILCLGMTLQHIFNRVACLMQGCCRGRYYNGSFALVYPTEVCSYPVYPTQPFEILCMLILLVILTVLYKKGKHVYVVFLSGFTITIFFSEFMMGREGVLQIFGLTIFQYVAVILGITAFYMNRKSNKR